MKKLWMVTVVMVVCGAVLALGGGVLGLGPVALVGGVLMFWSGLVKVIVLRVWRNTLPPAPLPEPARAGVRASTAVGEPT